MGLIDTIWDLVRSGMSGILGHGEVLEPLGSWDLVRSGISGILGSGEILGPSEILGSPVRAS